MPNRAQRRAAAAAAAAHQNNTSSSSISEAQLAANRANAQLSTGARTEIGKSISSMNALKTGLTGRTVLLPTDDVAIYQQHIARIVKKYRPTNDDEQALVQSIADTEWRLLRIAPLEEGIYAIGRRELADHFSDETNPQNREALIRTETFKLYRKELNNLALQERRLRNHRKDDIAELTALRAEQARQKASREDEGYSDACAARKILENAKQMKVTVDLADFGFEFSESELNAYFAAYELNCELRGSPFDRLNFDTFLERHRAAQQNTEKKAA